MKGETWLRVSTDGESGPASSLTRVSRRRFLMKTSHSSRACAIPRAATGVSPPRAAACATGAPRAGAGQVRPRSRLMQHERRRTAPDRRPLSRSSITHSGPSEPPRLSKRRECPVSPLHHRGRLRMRPRWEPQHGQPRSDRGKRNELGAGRGPRAQDRRGARFGGLEGPSNELTRGRS